MLAIYTSGRCPCDKRCQMRGFWGAEPANNAERTVQLVMIGAAGTMETGAERAGRQAAAMAVTARAIAVAISGLTHSSQRIWRAFG